MRYIDNAPRQWERLKQLLGTAECADIDGGNARQHLAGDIGLNGQRYIAQINVTLICVRIVEGQIHTLLALKVRVIVAHLGEYADLIDHRLDHVAKVNWRVQKLENRWSWSWGGELASYT